MPKCATCGRIVDLRSAKCPGCGRPKPGEPSALATLFGGILILPILFYAIAYLQADNGNESPTKQSRYHTPPSSIHAEHQNPASHQAEAITGDLDTPVGSFNSEDHRAVRAPPYQDPETTPDQREPRNRSTVELFDPDGTITIQSRPRLSSKNVAVVPAGTAATELSRQGNWVEIRLEDERTGFVKKRQISEPAQDLQSD